MLPTRTVLAIARAEISITPALSTYLEQYSAREDAWFARGGGDLFLAEMGQELNSIFRLELSDFFKSYLSERGLTDADRIGVDITDSRRGSWIMEAALTMFGGVGTTYTVLKGIGEIPKIADGIEEGKNRLQQRFERLFRDKVKERIEPFLTDPNATKPRFRPRRQKPPTEAPVNVSFSIDARPLRGLTPESVKSHAVHLAVGLSRSRLSVENLGEAALENVRIGLFKSDVQQNHWIFTDAFVKTVPTMSSKQTIAFGTEEFQKYGTSTKLKLDDLHPIYVDCWVQDNYGIYLFNF